MLAPIFDLLGGKSGFIFYNDNLSNDKTHYSFRYFISELDVFILDWRKFFPRY